ncbi:styrene monooxygenase/indole monooxygenase family protein [Allosalinactinospora lopnorensis]|uniref:styrene monooxygenase/indole monooxygenase family protein n=1 Tax=Allosalinactinospora lopnorensis TaxID=1352348 RepID=UPI000623FDC9|nr:styrene monooxygenase/indole monooxygenase family protein [Allosalinactinospora lopnorensis]
MRRVLIVGGGQSGLQLALSLLAHDYDVTVMTVHDPDELHMGRAVSVQILYDEPRRAEREYDLGFWDDAAQPITDFRISASGEMPPFDWTGRLAAPAQSIDERVKMSTWLDLFEHRGGKVIIHGATVSDLDHLAEMFDLTIIAAGHSGLAEMFSVDSARPLARMPPVATAIAYVEEIDGNPDRDGIGVDLVPGLGHMISWPTYSVNGRCRLVFLTGPADGALADWPKRITPQGHLDRMLDLMREFLPHRYEVYAGAELADDQAVALDQANPLVRHPAARTPSGRLVMGMGDTVVVTSPALQQDANNASKAAEIYLRSILEQEDAPFDEEFMSRTFARYMEYAGHFTGEIAARLHYTPPYVIDMCVAANRDQELADRFVNGFNDPPGLASWFVDEETTRAIITKGEGTR